MLADFPVATMVYHINSAYNRVNSVIRRHIDNYRPTLYSSSDITTGTAVPVLDLDFHEMIAIWASYEYAIEKGLPNAQLLLQEYSLMEKELDTFYGLRKYDVFTITIAAPGVITKDNHGLRTNDRVSFITTGALPTGIAADTFYYAVYIDDHTFKLTTTRDGTTYITTSGSQSGTHYYWTPDKQGNMTPNIENTK